MRLRIALKGDRRLTEKVILEVKAVARQLGMELENVEVVQKAPNGAKVRKASSARKPTSGRKLRLRV